MKPIPRLLRASMLAALLPLTAQATPPSAASHQEIEHLIVHLRNSGCEFQRNGSWFDSKQAADHLRKKYDYLLRKDLVATAEDFITRAGTESSMSNTPYQVRCADQLAQPSAIWLQAELKRYRTSK
jgi:hypothetical protein